MINTVGAMSVRRRSKTSVDMVFAVKL